MQKKYGNPGNDEESYDEILDTDISELVVEKGYSTPQKWQSCRCGWGNRRNATGCRTRNNTFSDKIFQCPLLKSQFPSEWTKAIMIPLHKKGDVNNPDNYRGIYHF